jgi:hypothetical protein
MFHIPPFPERKPFLKNKNKVSKRKKKNKKEINKILTFRIPRFPPKSPFPERRNRPKAVCKETKIK